MSGHSAAMRVDHVLLAVADLETAAATLHARHGLEAYEGGRHPQWGTANWIVPLGMSYLELVGVVDVAAAENSVFGRWVASEARAEPAPFAWCVTAGSLDATAERLGLAIERGSRTTPLGRTLGWRIAGLERAARNPWLPFFIDWSDAMSHPGRREGTPPSDLHVELEGDVDELASWLGTHSLPMETRAGQAGVVAVELDGPSGPVRLSRTG